MNARTKRNEAEAKQRLYIRDFTSHFIYCVRYLIKIEINQENTYLILISNSDIDCWHKWLGPQVQYVRYSTFTKRDDDAETLYLKPYNTTRN